MLRLVANHSFTHALNITALESHPDYAECLEVIMRSNMVFNEYAPQGEFMRKNPRIPAVQAELMQDIIRYAKRHNQKPDDVINDVLAMTLARGSEFANKRDVDAFVNSVRGIRASQRKMNNLRCGWDD